MMDAVASIFDVGSSVAAIVVAALAVVTIWEMGEQRREAAKPVLVVSGPNQLTQYDPYIVTSTKNIGSGPAFNISVTLTHPQLHSAKGTVASIDPETFEHVGLMFPEFDHPLFVGIMPAKGVSESGCARVEYWDIYGRFWKSITPLHLKFTSVTDKNVREDLGATPDDAVWSIQIVGFGNPRVSRNRRLFEHIRR
jgi:hypothetical protein